MGFYSEVLFPKFYDFVMCSEAKEPVRRELLESARGEVLEVGFGTGINLEFYPDQIKKITTVDVNPGMNREAQRRIDKYGIEVDCRLLRGDKLPFEASSFDTVVSAYTLCSIKKLSEAFQEIRRVLKSDGQFLFLEHGLSNELNIQKWQNRLNPFQRAFAAGCQLNLKIDDIIQGHGFQITELKKFYIERDPRTHGYTYLGKASPR